VWGWISLVCKLLTINGFGGLFQVNSVTHVPCFERIYSPCWTWNISVSRNFFEIFKKSLPQQRNVSIVPVHE